MPVTWEPDAFTGRRFGAYEVLCRMALGGMAEIFLGFGLSGAYAGVPVVLKRIVDGCREDPEALAMIVNEAKLTATLSHLNIARIFDLVADGEDVVLVIEFIPGVNLEELSESFASRGDTVPLGLVLAAVSEVAAGLERAHLNRRLDGSPQPVIHRDVTPRNIMIGFDGVTKLLDFGIARAAGTERHTMVGVVRGTTTYMSPEQAVGQEVDERTDLFSLGVVFHELLVGAPLFRRDTAEDEMAAVWGDPVPVPSSANPRVPRAIDAVVLRALERPLERRYASASDLRRDLAFAGGASAWPRAKSAELLRERFAMEREAILRCLDRIPADLAQSASDRSAGPPVLDLPERPGVDADDADDATSPAQLAPRAGGPAEAQDVESLEGAALQGPPVPIDMKTAIVPARPLTLEPRTLAAAGFPWGNAEAGPAGEAEPRPQGEPTAPGGVVPSRPWFPQVDFPATNPLTSAVGRGTLRRWIGAGALILLLGVLGGASFHKYRERRPKEAPRARLSLSTDRPVQVFFEGRYLGVTPLDALDLPAGRQTLFLLSGDGSQRRVDLELKADAHSKANVALDRLVAVP